MDEELALRHSIQLERMEKRIKKLEDKVSKLERGDKNG